MNRTKTLTYDYANMLRGGCGQNGKPEKDLPAMFSALEEARDVIVSHAQPGFFSIPDLKDELREAESLAAEVRRRFRTLVVVGIGGSDLGARALLSAVAPRVRGMEVKFLGANTDPEEVAAFLKDVDWKRTAINVVSKSGDTIEPMSAFLVLRDRLVRAVGKKAHAAHVICTTDRSSGTLRAIADREGYRTLPVPAGIGGRFSALTPVGLFPAACAGLDVRGLLAGAAAARRDFTDLPPAENPALVFAGLQHDAYFRGGRVTVFMPYAAALRETALWFRQLWAESLGKKYDRSGNQVRLGFTPVAALGATDQHSQIQLYVEGPSDKTVTFVEVNKLRADFTVPKPYPDIEGVAYMAGHRLGDILRAERSATARALAANSRPNGTLHLPDLSAPSLGHLMMTLMLATAVAAELLDVNAYDQPGVEDGKRIMYALLGRRGYSL